MAEQKPILYQLYKPQLKDCVTVQLHIKGSRNIPCSLYKRYSVNVCHRWHHFERRNVQDTHTKFSWCCGRLNWNETFTFHIDKSTSEVLQCDFEFQLMETSCIRPSVVDTKTCSLSEILKNKKVNFKGGIEISVELNEIEDIVKCIPDVRIRDQNVLCKEESNFREERSKTIKDNGLYKNLLKGETNTTQTEQDDHKYVPNIAVIGSGGGMRAVGGMCGAMTALNKKLILDLVMYTAGVSGSSWYISTLYIESETKLNPSDVADTIRNRLDGVEEITITSGLKMLFTLAWEEWSHTGKYETLTNLYGNAISNILLEKKMDMKWSSQTNKLEKGEVPLPLLAMLHVYDKEKPDELNEWVECSPYEVFMPKYGVGINMKHFGSEFDGGFVKTKYPEQPAHVLQGICGSAYIAVLETERRDIGAGSSFSVQSWISMIETFMTEKLEKIAVGKIPNWLYGVSDMKKILKEQEITRKDISKDDVKSMKKVVTEISWKDISINDVEVMDKVIKKLSWEDFSEDDKKRKEEDLKGISTDDPKKKNVKDGDIESMKKVLTNISREDITKGDVNNVRKVLKELQMDNKNLKMVVNDNTEIDINSMKKVMDSKNEALMLTDAGIKFNSPYPLVLHPARKIDLILSFEFSAPGDVTEWPFSELRKAQNWAECRNIPFPDLRNIDKYKREPIKNLYVFKGTNSPTIMHFVMYEESENETREQCESKVRTFFEEYPTLKFKYSEKEFDQLSNLMKDIVENNEQEIKDQIGEAIKSKRERESR